MMLCTDRSKRPSAEELLTLPQISFRAKERKLNQHYTALKKKEEELAAKVFCPICFPLIFPPSLLCYF
jgi:hypothetical protein